MPQASKLRVESRRSKLKPEAKSPMPSIVPVPSVVLPSHDKLLLILRMPFLSLGPRVPEHFA